MAVRHCFAAALLACLIASLSPSSAFVHLFIAARAVFIWWVSFVHHHLDFGDGLDQGMDFSIASWSSASSVSTACSVISGVDQVEFGKCRSAIVAANLAQYVVLYSRLGVNSGLPNIITVVASEYSDSSPDTGSHDYPLVTPVILLLVKERSRMRDYCPLVGKSVRMPGMFCRVNWFS